MEDLKDQSLHCTHRIGIKDKENFMVAEAPNGNYLNLRIKQDWEIENIRVEMYNKNDQFYTFFFSLTNDIDKFDHKHTYFAVQKKN